MPAPQISQINPVTLFTKHHNDWLHSRAEMAKMYGEIGGEIDRKEFDLFLSVTSISAAFLAIVLPLTSRPGPFFQFTTYLFAIEVVVGVGLMIINIIYSRKGVAHDSRWVSQQYERLIDESARLLDRAKAGSINQSDLDAYWTIREELHVGIDKIQKDRKESLPNRILKLSWIFYFIFLLGKVSLLVNAAQASSIQQPQNSYSQTTTLGKLSH